MADADCESPRPAAAQHAAAGHHHHVSLDAAPNAAACADAASAANSANSASASGLRKRRVCGCAVGHVYRHASHALQSHAAERQVSKGRRCRALLLQCARAQTDKWAEARQVRLSEAIELPAELLLHVGDALLVHLPAPLLRTPPAFFLYRTEAMQHPLGDSEVQPLVSDVDPNSQEVDSALLSLAADATGAPIERGEYAIVVRGVAADSGDEVEFVSTVFALDVDSCPVDLALFGVPYGLVRTAAACTARAGTVASVVSDALICCVSETTWRAVEQPRWSEVPVDAQGLLTAIDSLPAAANRTENVLLAYTQRGETLFWGGAGHARDFPAAARTDRADDGRHAGERRRALQFSPARGPQRSLGHAGATRGQSRRLQSGARTGVGLCRRAVCRCAAAVSHGV